jgi:hypothetical protein
MAKSAGKNFYSICFHVSIAEMVVEKFEAPTSLNLVCCIYKEHTQPVHPSRLQSEKGASKFLYRHWKQIGGSAPVNLPA